MPRHQTTPMRLRHTGDGVSLTIDDDAREVSRVRHLVRGLLPEWLTDIDADNAIIVVSELVTNALVHGRPPRFLTVQMHSRGLWIAVSDTSPTAAAQVDPVGRVGGRGLRIVERLSQEWGSTPSPPGEVGKSVWCLLRARGQQQATRS